MLRIALLFAIVFAARANADSLLTNGDFEKGEVTPTGWTAEADDGIVRFARDTSEKVSGEASLRVDTVNGDATGKAVQVVDIKPGQRLRLTGQAKTSANIRSCTIALLTQGSKQPWNELAQVSSNEWASFRGAIEIPEGTKRGLLLVYFAGNGSVWLDDLQLTEVDPDATASQSTVMTDFDTPFLFAYLSFEKKVGHADSQVTIRAKDGKGGAGTTTAKDWSAFDEFSPAIDIKLGPNNKAGQIKMFLTDGDDRKSTFLYDLTTASRTEFTRLLPIDGQPLASDELDTTNITGLQIQGAWTGDPLDVAIDKVELVEPTSKMLALRQEADRKAADQARRKQQQAMRAEQQRQRKLTEGVDHPADGPEVVHIGMASDQLIGIELQAGRVPPTKPRAYAEQPDDERKPTGKQQLAWKDGAPRTGQPVLAPDAVDILRADQPGGRKKKIGVLVPQAGTIWQQEKVGADLDLTVVDEPGAYRISIDGSDSFQPVAVYRKSKPNSIAMESGEFVGQHFIYLDVGRDVPADAEVTVEFFGVNTRTPETSFVFDSTKVRSEAIHISYLGYRPTDPLKRAYVSLWAGTGGGRTPEIDRFELIDSEGAVAFSGQASLGISADQPEPFVIEKNHTLADVYHLDFTDLTTPGIYRVHVPGLGVSEPFEIADSTWADAFRVSMQGFLTHRSGIELGPPVTDYVRPRNMHPDDNGFVVYQTDVTIWDGESDAIRESFTRLLGPDLDKSKLTALPDAWGGYMDAGDWDRRSQHLMCSLRHLELAEISSDAADIKLSLPPDEADNDIPDLIDEALWNIDFYRRLQTDDGGVRGGVESTAHPRGGEASWQESLLVGAFAPDPESTYRYAATAARAARLLADHKRAAGYNESALKAWQWAEANAERIIAEAKARGAKNADKGAKSTAEMRSLAAIELFRLTGDRSYHTAIDPKAVTSNADHAMAYALVPAGDANADLHKQTIDAVTRDADAALEFSQQNGFNIALFTRYLPLMGYTCIWSTPGSTTPPVLPRAHYLTGDEKYLAGTIASCQYAGGANPMNMCYTTGLGARQPLAPLHLDYRRSGQAPPAGITVYGQSDPAMDYGFDRFAHTWFLNRFGGVNSQQWPTAEAYIDLGNWPAMNEYTVHQTFTNTSYTWGYLAGRE